MSNRIIFQVKHGGKCLAYIYQNWGMGDGEELEQYVREAATKYGYNLTKRADAIQVVRLAGERLYGHAKWTANENEHAADWRLATAKDRAYLMAHRKDIIADNQADGVTFFYGTYGDYPAYIQGWCEDAYTMAV